MRWARPAVAVVLALGCSSRAPAEAESATVDRAGAFVVGDQACRSCHEKQWTSWHASYHRTMTQEADIGVLAPFAGETLAALGFVATMSQGDAGRPSIRIVDDRGDVIIDSTVELAVGSHRYQQYVARIDRGGGAGELWRLPVAWHIEEARWIHINVAFLAPDGENGEQADYLRHLDRYNDNCIFCHNTEPVPGLAENGQWHSEVGQWGIACEACHGPASVHVDRRASLVGRVMSAVSEDGSITDPGAVSADRSNEICGRCHGQRIGHDIAQILAHGDGFVPGTLLDAVSRPIFRDSTVANGGKEFASRFWPDGTPRLSAYEFQGLVLSPCTGLSCGDCHDMHGETPSMQMRSDWDPTTTCRGCHAIDDVAQHGGHSAAVTCVDCHMPHTTYGLLEGMVSHRITTPAPAALVGRHDAPDACTQCHVDQTRAWAAAAWPRIGLGAAQDMKPSDPIEAWAPRVVLDLHGGDPIQRALAAHALARPGAPVPAGERLEVIVDAMADDYAAVRWMAWRGAKRLAGSDTEIERLLAEFDPAGPIEQRLAAWRGIREHLGASTFAQHPERQAALEARRDGAAIWIGE